MKILLSVSVSEERFNCIPDIGLGYLATLARDAGHEVEIVDCLLEEYSFDDFEEHVRRKQPDLVGVKAYSADLEPIREMCRRVKQVSADIQTMVGGPHPSTEVGARLYSHFPSMDFAFAGEAEPGFVAFLETLVAGKKDYSHVPGLVWRNADGEIQANEKAVVEDLDSLPMPAWDLLQPQRYKWGYSFMNTKYPAAPMVFTRGCPYLCTFCGSYLITGRKIRRRSPDDIVAEVKYLKENFGIRSLDIVDENLVFHRKYLITLCERFIEEDLDIAWNCPYGVRLDRLDEEMVRLMERAGCFALSLGLESGSDRILKQIKKVLTVEQTIEKVNMIKRVSNIMLQGFFMMGFPTETKAEVEQTIDLAAKLPLDIAVFSPLRVTPGTEIYESLVADGTIYEEVDYAGLGQHYFVRSYCDVSDEEMRRLYRRAYLKFYSRPSVVLGLFRNVRSAAQTKTLINGFGRLLARPVTRKDPRKKKPRNQEPTLSGTS